MFRIGIGNDIHRLERGRPLIIGGVIIVSDKGSIGHSDADVLLHAITDALLGTLALGDIGTHFPNSEERWQNAESSVFLRYARGLVKSRGFVVANVDSTVNLESPKLLSYVDAMRENIANALEIETSQVSVKAKTGEGVDAIGKGEAIRAEAAVLISRD